MKRRDFLRTAGVGAAAALAACRDGREQRKPPNILFLFSDDQRFDTIGALNNPVLKTPHIDRLVRNGTSFSRAHIMGGTSGAVCMPSRAMLLTGRHLFHLKEKGASIPSDHILLPELFRRLGYVTFGTGKWHNSRSAYARCFSDGGAIFFGGMSNHLQVPVYDFDPSGVYPPENMYHAGKFSSRLFSDQAIRFLENHSDDRPFFGYVSFTAPHDPRMAPRAFSDLYPPDSMPLPPNFLPEHPFDNGELRIRDEKLAPFPRTPEIIRRHIADYYAMITHLDDQIGSILDALEQTGLAQNTLVVFAGDNGLAVGRHGLLGKQNLYDHSVRVPLIFSGPGIPAGKTSQSLCYLQDIFPTICERLNIKIPDTVEGASLLPALDGEVSSIRKSVFLAYRHLMRGIKTADDWKLILTHVEGQLTSQLFNLGDDPWEMNNLADNTSLGPKKEELIRELKNWMFRLDDFCDLDRPGWVMTE